MALSRHTFSSSISGSGSNALTEPVDVAVDQSSGDVYVVDAGNFRVEKFTPSGEFIFMVGQEVDKSKSEQLGATPTEKNLCTAASGDTCQPAPSRENYAGEHSGVLPGDLANPIFVAVDNSGGLSAGDFYVVSAGSPSTQDYITKFDSAGHLITSWAEGGQQKLSFSYSSFLKEHIPPGTQVAEDPVGALVDEGGDLVFSTADFGTVFRVGQFGSFISAFTTENTMRAARLALGPDNDILAAGAGGLHQLTPTGADLGPLTGPGFSGSPTAFATDLADGQIYVADAGNVIRHYAPPCDPAAGPCTPTDSFGGGELNDVTGLSVDESSDVVYAADQADSRVEIFSPTSFLPDTVANLPTYGPTDADATLAGTVNPAEAGDVTACEFSYVTNSAYNANDVNEAQTITIAGATEGTYTLSFKGHTTEPIGLQASGATPPNTGNSGSVEENLEALPAIGANDVRVIGEPGGPYRVEFVGNLARQNLPQLTIDGSNLTPQPGAEAVVATEADGGDGWGTAVEAPCLNEQGEVVNAHPIADSNAPTDVHAQISGLTPETTYRYRFAATNGNGTELSRARTFTPHVVLGLTTEPASHLSGEAATLEATFIGGGEETHYHFEWGTTRSYGEDTAVETNSATGSQSLSSDLTGLSPNTTYHYRAVAANEAAEASAGEDQEFTTPSNAPLVQSESAAKVGSETALIHAEVNPGSGDTIYRAEYGTDTSYGNSTPVFGNPAGNGSAFIPATVPLEGLTPGVTYHYRIVAENSAATTPGSDRTFTTFPNKPAEETCPNAHVRQQTSAAFLLDCRAYELVSAANAGGYDVESNLIEGQTPFGGFPEANGRVLYGVHDGGIPGTDHPTDRGIDPYVATRGAEGWSTEYVGIPSNATPSTVPFSSTLTGADAGLGTFAFGGSEICSPCFSDTSTGQPLRLPDGSLIQGMAGPEMPGPGAQSAGYVAKPLSPDGSHFIFGSTSKFASGGNSNGQISIYDRELNGGETHVVSNDPTGTPLPCEENCSSNGIAELDISKDGSHILLGQLVAEEGSVKRWRLYMDVGDSPDSIELAPGATEGVLFDGMTADGSKVFLSSPQHLTGEDPEHSGADIYLWEDGKPLTLISKGPDETPGAPGNTAACDPSANTLREHWNTTGVEEDCGAVAVGGSGGVGVSNGAIYFLSPEKLAGSSQGVDGAPNLYLARPAEGYTPRFVTTLESSSNAPLPQAQHPLLRSFGALSKPTAVAVDHSNGDVYVLDVRNTEGTPGAFVAKFDSSGNAIPSFGEGGQVTGASAPSGKLAEFGAFGMPGGIAVDNDPGSASFGDFYVPNMGIGAVYKFSSSGTFESEIPIAGFPTATAVNPANGDLFVSNLFGGVEVFSPTGAPITTIATIPAPANLAVDASGTVYVANGSVLGEAFFGVTHSQTEAYEPSSTSPLEYNPPGEREVDSNPSVGVAVDPSSGHVYVDERTKVSEFDSSGSPVGGPIGSGLLLNSVGLAADGGDLYVSNPGSGSPPESGKVAVFGPAVRPHDPETDNPLVIDSVSSPEARHTADFQLTPSGDFAAFPSTLPLAGYESSARTEVFRYDAAAQRIDCASCAPTGAEAVGDASLAPQGLSLTGSGQVFFTTPDPLIVPDTDNRKDVYEWEMQGSGNCGENSPSFEAGTGACLALISAGTSTFDSGLLSVDSSGKNVYFFTRDGLVPQDTNGPTMKIYDAREEGGFGYLFPPTDCKASDECHGASSPPPPPLAVGSEAGSPHNVPHEAKHCPKNQIRRHGRCVKKPHHRRTKHHRGGKK